MSQSYTLEQVLQPSYNAPMQVIDAMRQKPVLEAADIRALESSIELLCAGEAPYFTDPNLRLRAFEDLQFLIERTHKPANSDAQVMAIFLALRLRESSYRVGHGEEARRYTHEAYQMAVDFFMKESEDGTYPELGMLLRKIEILKRRYSKFSLIAVESGLGNDLDWIEGSGGPLPEAQMRNLRIDPAS